MDENLQVSNFSDVIGIVFNNWTALKMVLENSYGNITESFNKIEKLCEEIMQLLDKGEDWMTVADLLENSLDEGFNTLVEDDSCDEVAKEIDGLFFYWKSGDSQAVMKKVSGFPQKATIFSLKPALRNRLPPVESGEESSDSSEGEDMEVEDPGWTVVRKKR